MSFITVTAYAVVCDACGERFLGHEGEQIEETTAAISDTASAYGWVCTGGRHVCSECQHTRGIKPSDITINGVAV